MSIPVSLYDKLDRIVHDFDLNTCTFMVKGNRWGWSFSFIDDAAYNSFLQIASQIHAARFDDCEDWEEKTDLQEWLFQEYEIYRYKVEDY